MLLALAAAADMGMAFCHACACARCTITTTAEKRPLSYSGSLRCSWRGRWKSKPAVVGFCWVQWAAAALPVCRWRSSSFTVGVIRLPIGFRRLLLKLVVCVCCQPVLSSRLHIPLPPAPISIVSFSFAPASRHSFFNHSLSRQSLSLIPPHQDSIASRVCVCLPSHPSIRVLQTKSPSQ